MGDLEEESLDVKQCVGTSIPHHFLHPWVDIMINTKQEFDTILIIFQLRIMNVNKLCDAVSELLTVCLFP